MKAFIAVLTVVFGVHSIGWSKDNGSSVIGNKLPIIGNLEALVPKSSKLEVQGNQIVDASTGEIVLRIEILPEGEEKSARKALQSDKKDDGDGEWVQSRLGSVIGLEFLPRTQKLGEFPQGGKALPVNRWVVCEVKVRNQKDTGCIRLQPVSRTHRGVLEVVGSLRLTSQ